MVLIHMPADSVFLAVSLREWTQVFGCRLVFISHQVTETEITGGETSECTETAAQATEKWSLLWFNHEKRRVIS